MRMHFITFRSVTPAQRGQRLLQQAGISCYLQRTPRYMQDRGCGYCLRLRPRDTPEALTRLKAEKVPFMKLYTEENGIAEEMTL